MTRKTGVLVGAAALAAVIATGAAIVMSRGTQPTAAAPEPTTNTATVKQGPLSAVVSQDGTLTFQGQSDGSPYSVINQARGTYTKLPAPGQVLSQGQVLYRVNDTPVVLLYGSTPAYRALSADAAGADVAELNAALVALGYATSAQLSPTSASFGSATTTAVEKLQAALEVTQDGTLALGQAVFEPTAVRVTTLPAQLGGSAQAGQTVIQGSSTTRIVRVALGASEQTEVAVGDMVSITLPDNKTTQGRVSAVGTVATCPSSSGSGGSGSSSDASRTDTCSSDNSGSSTPTVTVEIIPSDAAVTGMWDQAPVQVGITTSSVPNALAVPVTALLAQSSGTYVVEVVGTGGTSHLVPVSLGLFDAADGLVQVSGSGLAAGQHVVVPAT